MIYIVVTSRIVPTINDETGISVDTRTKGWASDPKNQSVIETINYYDKKPSRKLINDAWFVFEVLDFVCLKNRWEKADIFILNHFVQKYREHTQSAFDAYESVRGKTIQIEEFWDKIRQYHETN